MTLKLSPGLHPDIEMADYLALEALGSGRLAWLAESPAHYRHMLDQPREETDATGRGTAVHMATLEPELFEKAYIIEPELSLIAPGAIKPRATNAYKEAIKALRAEGREVLRPDEMADVRGMSAALRVHPVASDVLDRCTRREITMIWQRKGRLCRGRADGLGSTIMADVKTTRSLKDFSPWTITKLGYYRQAALYIWGAAELGITIEAFFHLVVESEPPYDVGVFTLDTEAIDLGMLEVNRLLELLDKCEKADSWPGRFPEMQRGFVTEAIVNQLYGEDAA